MQKVRFFITLFILLSLYSPASAQEDSLSLPEGLQPISVDNAASVSELSVIDPYSLDLPKFVIEGDRAENTDWLRARAVIAASAGLGGSDFSNDNTIGAVALIEDVWINDEIIGRRPASGGFRIDDAFDDAVTVALSPDAAVVAVADEDGTVALWDVVEQVELFKWQADASYVNDLAFSPDGSILASNGDDQSVHLWNPETSEQVTQFALPDHPSGLAFSPDGTLLAAGGAEGVTIWDVASGEQTATLEAHRDYAPGLAFNPDGTVLASGSSDGTIYLWDVAGGTLLATLTGEVSETEYLRTVVYLEFSPDSALLLSSNQDGLLHFWGATSN